MTRTRLDRPQLRLERLEDRVVPATFTVNSTFDNLTAGDGKLTLREAVSKANGHEGSDVIVVPAGVYTIALAGQGDDNNFVGDFDVRDTVTIRGAGDGKTVIDGQRIDRVFDVRGNVSSPIKVVFEGLTVCNGEVTNPFLIDNYGGGVRFGNAGLVVRDCAVTGNRAAVNGGGISNYEEPGGGNVTIVRTTVASNIAGEYGGGLLVFAGETGFTVKDSTIRRNAAKDGGGITSSWVTLTNSTVSGNAAQAAGGGILANFVTLTGSTVSGNTAGTDGGGISAISAMLTSSTVSGNTAGGQGGGVRITWEALLTNCTLTGNAAGTNGGGVWTGDAALTRCTVSGNTAGGQGGGVNVDNDVRLTNCRVSGNAAGTFGGGIAANAGEVDLVRCTVDGNRANQGGGINAEHADLVRSTVSGNTAAFDGGGVAGTTSTLANSTVSGNTAGDQGGGVWAVAADLVNCTVAENIARTGGGLFHEPGGTFSVKNTIVALNLVGLGGADPDVSGIYNSGGHNLIGDYANGVNFGSTFGDIVGGVSNPVDPKLAPLANNGGPTKTHRLLAGSPAIDRGDNANLPPTDQRGPGFSRVKDGNGDGRAVVDIGAFER